MFALHTQKKIHRLHKIDISHKFTQPPIATPTFNFFLPQLLHIACGTASSSIRLVSSFRIVMPLACSATDELKISIHASPNQKLWPGLLPLEPCKGGWRKSKSHTNSHVFSMLKTYISTIVQNIIFCMCFCASEKLLPQKITVNWAITTFHFWLIRWQGNAHPPSSVWNRGFKKK